MKHYPELDPEEGGRRARAAEARVSERRACRVIGQPSSSQLYVAQKAPKERVLVERLVALSPGNPRYGYRRAWALLRREGWKVNIKRVQRSWTEEA